MHLSCNCRMNVPERALLQLRAQAPVAQGDAQGGPGSTGMACVNFQTLNLTAGKDGKRLSRKAARKEGLVRKAAGDDVTRAFKEAQASVDAAELRKAQSATLEALFEALFRVLKHASASGLLALGRPGALGIRD